MSINNKVIAEIAQKSPTAGNFFTYAACRERNVRDGESRLSSIKSQMTKEGFIPVPQDLLLMFKELERIGVGILQGDKFKWLVPIKKIGDAIREPRREILSKHEKSLVICFDKHKEASVLYTPNLTKADVHFLCEKLLNECQA